MYPDMGLGDRMKQFYEGIQRSYLMRKIPVIIRLDGVSFHTRTKVWGLKTPFDDVMIDSMVSATKFLMSRIDGAKVGYVASDEASILVTDTDGENTDSWFAYNIQKIVSVTASMMTAAFNDLIRLRLTESQIPEDRLWGFFDSRCFNIPVFEVENYFYWRFKDFERNSVHMLARSLYSQNELNGKKLSDMHEMIYQKDMNWAAIQSNYKNGTFLFQESNRLFDVVTGGFSDDLRVRIRSNAQPYFLTRGDE